MYAGWNVHVLIRVVIGIFSGGQEKVRISSIDTMSLLSMRFGGLWNSLPLSLSLSISPFLSLSLFSPDPPLHIHHEQQLTSLPPTSHHKLKSAALTHALVTRVHSAAHIICT